MSLSGLRLMIVEDEALLSLDLEDLLTQMGCTVVCKAARLRDAVKAAAEADIDLAILDLNLAGERVDPVADILSRRGVPFVFTTGYGESGIDPRFRSVVLVEKPYDGDALRPALLSARSARDAV